MQPLFFLVLADVGADLGQLDGLRLLVAQLDGQHSGALLIPLILRQVGKQQDKGARRCGAGGNLVAVVKGLLRGQGSQLRKDLSEPRNLLCGYAGRVLCRAVGQRDGRGPAKQKQRQPQLVCDVDVRNDIEIVLRLCRFAQHLHRPLRGVELRVRRKQVDLGDGELCSLVRVEEEDGGSDNRENNKRDDDCSERTAIRGRGHAGKDNG